jgi:phosphatidyl-myo-inositol dimannoside synthase
MSILPALRETRSGRRGDAPLRLLITAFDYRPRLGGVATCSFELARALAGEGVHVRVLAPHCPGDEAFDRHGLFETARRDLPSAAVAALLPLCLWIREEMAAWQPDALLATLWQPGGLAMRANAFRRRSGLPPYFVMAHGVEMMESHRNLRKRARALLAPLKRSVFRHAAAPLAVSHFTAGLVEREVGLPAGSVAAVFNGVDVDQFTPGPRPADLQAAYGTAGRRVLLTITRLDDYKGVDHAIGALRHVVRDHPEVLYLIGGEGADRPRLEELAHRHCLQQHVRFLGRVETTRLVEHYRLADCFVMLSREDLAAPNVEGFGIVFLEAASCGLPVIAGRSGGIPDAVAEGRTAWLVDPVDEQAIAAAMREMLGDPSLAAERGRNGRLRAEQEFTWGHMARRVLATVEQHVRH